MARRKNKKRIDPRYFLNETTYRDLDEIDELKMVGADSNQVRDPAAATSTGEGQMQKLLDAGVDPGHLNACKAEGGDLVKCLYMKSTANVRPMRDAGLIPQQAGS